MKKISLVVMIVLSLGGLYLFSNDAEAAETKVSDSISSYGIIFEEGFNNGLTGWGTEGDVRVEQKNSNKYIYLVGKMDCPPLGGCYFDLAAIQTTLNGFVPGKTYKFSIRAIGIGKIAVNSSSYQISVDDGNTALDVDNAKIYSTSVQADSNGRLNITILAYGTKMLVDDIKVED